MKLHIIAAAVPTKLSMLSTQGGLPQMATLGVGAYLSFHDLPKYLPIQLRSL